MPAFEAGPNGFLDVPARTPKPRSQGLTHILDKGLSLRDIEGLFETAGEYVDVVKLGWGTSYVTGNLKQKIALYRSFDTPVVCGGTLFEAVVARDKLDEYRAWLLENEFSHVEVSDGTIELPRERKLDVIAELAQDFVVMSEVGSKDAEVVYAPFRWVDWMREELEAGAWKVITEGREGGTAGIYRPTGDLRTGLVDEIVHEIDLADIVFEAPTEVSQAWFVRKFGPDVNLGNVPPQEVIPLETLRLGLRSDTLKEILLREHAAPVPDRG
jgi:phosphosulfolactate synthase